MGTHIDIKVSFREELVYFIKLFAKNILFYSIFFFLCAYLLSVLDYQIILDFKELTSLWSVAEKLIVYMLVPLLVSLFQYIFAIKRYKIEGGYLYVKNYKYKLNQYDITILHPRRYSELQVLFSRRKRAVILQHEKIKTVIPCDILSDINFQLLTETIQENQRRVPSKTSFVLVPDLDNVIFKTRSHHWEFINIKKIKRKEKIFLATLLIFLIASAIGGYYLMQGQHIIIILIGLSLLFIALCIQLIQLLYGIYIPKDTIINVQLTERTVVFELLNETKIFRTHRVKEMLVGRKPINNREQMRELTFVIDEKTKYEFEYTYGRENSIGLEQQYYMFVEKLQKFFGDRFHFKDN